MPKSRQRWVTNLSISSKVSGSNSRVDALARRQLARVALAAQPLLAAAQLGAALQVVETSDIGSVGAVDSLDLCGLRLLPVLQELLEADVGERMLEALLDHRRRHGHDVGAHARRLDDVNRVRTLATSTSVANS